MHALPIKDVLEKRPLIPNKKRWGFYLMSGFREIPYADFDVLRKGMMLQRAWEKKFEIRLFRRIFNKFGIINEFYVSSVIYTYLT